MKGMIITLARRSKKMLENISVDVWVHVLLPYLSARDVARLGRVNRRLHRITMNNHIWKHLLEEDFVDVQTMSNHASIQHLIPISDVPIEDLQSFDEDVDKDHTKLIVYNEEEEETTKFTDYRKIYIERARSFYEWRESLYLTRRISTENRNRKWMDSLSDIFYLFITYAKILIWMFLNPTVQPGYVPACETDRIKRQALDAGSYLITTLMFLPLLISSVINYVDTWFISSINIILQTWMIFACFILFKYGRMTSPVNINSEQGIMQMRVAKITWCIAFIGCVLMKDLLLNNVIVIILSINLAIARSLQPMLAYRTIDSDITLQQHQVLLNAQYGLLERLFHGNSLVSATLNGLIFAVVMGIGGIKFTVAAILIAVFVVLGANPISILQFLELMSAKNALLSMISGVVSLLLFYTTKWSLLTGGFPRRRLLQRLTAWGTLITLMFAHLTLLIRVISVVLFGSSKWSIESKV
jgi:hypothetical protein